jgi:tRNA A-37 threonylcarbamoyl transferase component Bud32
MSGEQASDITAAIQRRCAGPWTWQWVGTEALSLDQKDWVSPDRLLQPPAQRLVRLPPSQTTEVFRVPHPGSASAWFVKRYRPCGIFGALKSFFRSSRALRSFQLALKLQSLGILTASPIAAGERRRGGWVRESYLITREVPSVLTWFDCDDRFPSGPHRIPLLRQLACYFARLHDAGLSPTDANRNNLLVEGVRGGQPRLFLIDLDGLATRGRISPRRVCKDLLRLMARGPASPRERLWFLAEYCRSRQAPLVPRLLARQLWHELAARGDAFSATRDTDQRTFGEHSWLLRRSMLRPGVERVLREPDQFLQRARVLKPSRSSALSAGDGVVLKRYNYRKWTSRWKDLFRESRGPRSFWKAYLLECAGIPTALPIAASDQRWCGLVRRSYLLMEEVPGAKVLSDWTGDWRRGALLLADLLARMHNTGFSHRDLKDANLVVDAAGQFRLIDLDGLRYQPTVGDRAAAADLARLYRSCLHWARPPTRTNRARFLRYYSRRRKRLDWKWWWRTIDQLSRE